MECLKNVAKILQNCHQYAENTLQASISFKSLIHLCCWFDWKMCFSYYSVSLYFLPNKHNFVPNLEFLIAIFGKKTARFIEETLKKIFNTFMHCYLLLNTCVKAEKSWPDEQTAKEEKESSKFREITANSRKIDEKLDVEKNSVEKNFFFAVNMFQSNIKHISSIKKVCNAS